MNSPLAGFLEAQCPKLNERKGLVPTQYKSHSMPQINATGCQTMVCSHYSNRDQRTEGTDMCTLAL